MVGGYFSSVGGGIPAASLARWDGTSWTDVNGGVGSGGPGDYQYVFALEPCGQDLFVGGNFSSAGGVPIEFIARYDGADWFALGSGVNGNVWDFAQDENTLFVTGEFGTAGGVLCNSIASWDGYEWSPLGSGLNDHAYSLGVFDDDLYVGGWFYLAGGKPSWQIGRWMGASSEVDDRLVPPAPLVRLSNPYQAGSAIHLDLPALGPAEVSVFDAAGRLIRRLFAGRSGPGPIRVSWDYSCDDGHEAGPGIYFLRARSGARVATEHLVIVN